MNLVIQRLNMEFKEIRNMCGIYKININHNHLNFFIEDIFSEYHDITLHIVFKLTYLIPPCIYINNTQYLDIINKSSDKYGYNNSIVCLDSWKSSIKLKDILDEIIQNKEQIIDFLSSD